MSCCRIDAIHSGTARGQIETIDNNISTYITYPLERRESTSKGDLESEIPTTDRPKWPRAILYLTEAYGLPLVNSHLLADTLAEALQCPVIIPDQFNGNGLPVVKPPGWDAEKELAAFQLRHHPGTVDPILESTLNWIHRPITENGLGGVGSLGGVGYCFGGRYVMRLLAKGKIDAGVVNHPSFFTIEEVKDLGRASSDGTTPAAGRREKGFRPLAIFAAEEDDILPESKRRATEDALKEGGVTWWCSTFGQTTHGFSVRGDLSHKEVRFAAQTALTGAVSWFNEFLKPKTTALG